MWFSIDCPTARPAALSRRLALQQGFCAPPRFSQRSPLSAPSSWRESLVITMLRSRFGAFLPAGVTAILMSGDR